VPLSRDNPRFAQNAAVIATAEALLARLEVAARSPADARAIVARVLASRATAEERAALAAVVAGRARQNVA
jgi:hypothetical protein